MNAASAQLVRGILFDVGNTLTEIDYDVMAELADGAVGARQLRHLSSRVWRALDAYLEMCWVAGTTPSTLRFFLDAWVAELGLRPGIAGVWVERLITENRRRTLWRRPLPAAASVLAELKERGIALGVVSNADGKVRELLEECAVAHFFDVVVDSRTVGVEKPDSRVFLPAVAALGLEPRQIAYVGDLPAIDVRGAIAADLLPVLIDPADQFANRVRHLAADSGARVSRLLGLEGLLVLVADPRP